LSPFCDTGRLSDIFFCITLSAGRRDELVRRLEESDLVLVEDDPYGDLRYSGEEVQPVKAYDREKRVVYLGSFSKRVVTSLSRSRGSFSLAYGT
jgi:DNA-binding transcriptional MocR family regulator